MKNQQVINQTQYNEKPLSGIFDAELLKKVSHLKNQDDANGDGKSRQVSLALGELGYASRGLCISEQSDIVQLPAFLETRFDWIYRHLQSAGLNPSANIVWDESLETTGKIIADNPGIEAVLYMFGRKAHSVFPDEKRIWATELANSKNDFMKLCASLEVSIPKTFCYDRKAELPALDTFEYPVFLKSDVSVAGYGVVECADADSLKKALENVGDQVRFQVQKKVANLIASINVQYRAVRGKAKRFAITEQVLEKGTYHIGNRYPALINPWSATDVIASVLSNMGVAGIFAFDVVIDNRGRTFVIECNPRFNGATTPTLVAKKLSIDNWQAVTFKHYGDLNQLDLGKFLYNSEKKSGAVVLTWGVEHKLGILIAGTEVEQAQIVSGLKNILA